MWCFMVQEGLNSITLMHAKVLTEIGSWNKSFKKNERHTYWYVHKLNDCKNISKRTDFMSNFGNNDENYEEIKNPF